MGDFRARDADRDQAVEVIEAAFADRQLGDADRDLRLSRARAAETLDELTGLTRDLRVPAGHVAPVVVAPRTAGPTRTRRVRGVVVGLGAFVVLVVAGVTGVVGLAMFAVSGDPDVQTSRVHTAPAEAVEEREGFDMTPPAVRRFLRDYEREFSRLDAFQTVLFPDRVSVEVPAPGPRARYTSWIYDGTWRKVAAATAVVGSAERVDLGAIDVRRLFATIATAPRVLRVDDGALTHVVVRRTAGRSTVVNIYVGNELDESAYLSTTPSGEEIRRYPYRG